MKPSIEFLIFVIGCLLLFFFMGPIPALIFGLLFLAVISIAQSGFGLLE